MIQANVPVRLLVISDPGPSQEQIIAALSAQEEFQLVKVIASLEKLTKEIHAAEPDLIIIGHQVGGQTSLDVIDDIVMQFPGVPLVAILPTIDPLRAQQVTLAGARAFIAEPFTQVTLLSTLRRVRDLEARRVKSQERAPTTTVEEKQPIRAFAVFSPRGGVGCSTLASNLAVELLLETGAKVLLVDGKLFFGHLDVLLNIRSRNSIADLVPHANALDAGIIGDVVMEHSSGIHVLTSPVDVQIAQGFRAEDLFNILNGVKRAFDFVIIDAGSALTENTVTMMDAAQRILLVTTPDLVALHDTSRFIQIGRTLSYPADKLLVVLNRANQVGGLRTKDIETALHHDLFAQIPDDSPNVLRSINRGIPLVVRYPRSPASQAIRRLAKTLVSLSTPEAVGAAAKASPKKAREQTRPAAKRPARATATQRAKT